MTAVRPLVLALEQGDLGGAPVPALLPLGGVTLLDRLLLNLGEVCSTPAVVLTPPSRLEAVARLLGGRGEAIPVASPGRLAALRCALDHVATGGADTILVHDVRCALTPPGTIAAVLAGMADDVDAVAPGVAVTDSVKADAPTGGLRNVDRDGLTSLQSPRLLRRSLLVAVVEAPTGPDDEILRALGRGARVRRVPGSHRGEPVSDRLSLWQAQIALGLARDTVRTRLRP